MLISQFCHAKEPENWKLVKHDRKKGIEIYLRVLSDGNIEFKGITYIKTSLNSIVALFEDTDSLHKWLYKTKKVTILKRLNDKENYVYSIHNMPFLFSNRDSIVHTTVAQDPESYTVTIRGKATPDYLPEKKGFVRVRQVESFWRFEPQENGNVRIVFQGYGDPGGKIRIWAALKIEIEMVHINDHLGIFRHIKPGCQGVDGSPFGGLPRIGWILIDPWNAVAAGK